VYERLIAWGGYDELCSRSSQLTGGDILFLVSATEIVRSDVTDRYRATLVLHASALPEGRGWSPHIWDVVNGAEQITVTLLEAAEAVDSGDIWAQREIPLTGTELYDEINAKLFDAEIDLMRWAVDHFGRVTPRKQEGVPSYHRRRTPEDSRLDADKSLAQQFNLMRVADPKRFPNTVELGGKIFKLTLERVD
jgi:methionyl-tRNA formyltransferase